MLRRIAAEPPFRLFAREIVRRTVRDPVTRARWSADTYPHYLAGLVEAASVARADHVPAITAIEFGVASGRGLLMLQGHARRIEAHTGIVVHVVGFDAGTGLPNLTDYRDHPDYWQAGDFPMDEPALRRQLTERTQLVIGDVRETVGAFCLPAPVGFVSFDLDLYSGTAAALVVLRTGAMLRRTPLYFDDVSASINHRWAGELLAVDEFNCASRDVKIDRWRGVRDDRVFPEHGYWDGMFMAHDLRAISEYALQRDRRHL